MNEQFRKTHFWSAYRMAAVVTAVLTFLSVAKDAHAEGARTFNGAYGVNRVIITNGGYKAADGTAEIVFVIPAEKDGTVIATTHRTNPYDDKPSAYFGARELTASNQNFVEADAGLQYETYDYRSWIGTEEGWAAFSSATLTIGASVNKGWTNPKVWVSRGGVVDTNSTLDDGTYNPSYNPDGGSWVAWRGGKQNAGEGYIKSYMRFNIMDDGSLLNHIEALNTLDPNLPNAFFWNNTIDPPALGDRYPNGHLTWPWEGLTRFSPATDGAARGRTAVKRVVAMTRASSTDHGETIGHSELDGSFLSVDFTNCQVMPIGSTALRTWVYTDIDQSRTGYDAPATLTDQGNVNHQAYDRRSDWTPKGDSTPGNKLIPGVSHTIVGFRDLSGNTPYDIYNFNMRGATADGYYRTRYQNEKTDIMLMTATRIIGEDLTSGTGP